MNNKKLYNKAHNPTKRETEPYKEGNKNDIRHGPKPYKEDSKTWSYKEGSNIVQQKYNTKLNNNKQNYSTTTTTTKKKKNNTTATTPNDTDLDHNSGLIYIKHSWYAINGDGNQKLLLEPR